MTMPSGRVALVEPIACNPAPELELTEMVAVIVRPSGKMTERVVLVPLAMSEPAKLNQKIDFSCELLAAAVATGFGQTGAAAAEEAPAKAATNAATKMPD